MKLKQLRFLLVLLTFLFFGGCVGTDFGWSTRDTLPSGTQREVEASRLPPYIPPAGGVDQTAASSFPWQVWGFGRDLTGNRVENLQLLEGDELWKRRQFSDSIIRYRKARIGVTDRGLLDAIVIRIAGAELALGNPEGALRELSNFFKKTGRSEDSVDAPFSLIFGFAYGSRGDVDQSLAWFSRTNRLHAGIGGYHQSSEDAVRSLLRIPATHEIHRMSNRWKTDSFVSLLLGQELRRRSAPDFREPTGARFTRFWQVQKSGSTAYANASSIGDGQRVAVGVILPLSGNYSPLGKSVQGGIDLAVLGQQATEQYTFEYRDSLGDPLRAVSAFREFNNSQAVPVVIGPLLSEAAMDVSDIARRSPVSMVTFSKRSSFLTGSGVFRLGPTLESQLASLLDVAVGVKGYRRIAVLTTSDRVGQYYGEVFRSFAQERGVDIVFDSTYSKGVDTDLVALAVEIERLDVDAVFFPGSLKEASRFAGNLSAEKRAKAPLLGLGVWDNPRVLAQSRTILDGATFVSPFFVKSKRPIIKQFIESYRRRYGTSPDFLAAQGFDVATLVIAALRRAQATGISFPEALHSVDVYDGLTGTIQVSRSGEVERSFQIVEIKRGTLVPVMKTQPRASMEPSYIMRGDQVVEAPSQERLESQLTQRSPSFE